jgi:hypothetical protein
MFSTPSTPLAKCGTWSHRNWGGESLPEVCKRAKTADGSLGAVSILCPVLIRGKMLENIDMMNNNMPGE